VEAGGKEEPNGGVLVVEMKPAESGVSMFMSPSIMAGCCGWQCSCGGWGGMCSWSGKDIETVLRGSGVAMPRRIMSRETAPSASMFSSSLMGLGRRPRRMNSWVSRVLLRWGARGGRGAVAIEEERSSWCGEKVAAMGVGRRPADSRRSCVTIGILSREEMELAGERVLGESCGEDVICAGESMSMSMQNGSCICVDDIRRWRPRFLREKKESSSSSEDSAGVRDAG
jgi:hypothetical protein